MNPAFVRTAIFWIAALWILLSPAWVQVGHRKSSFVRPWQMYAGVGRGTCDVRFYNRTDDGDEEVSRLETLRPGVPLYDVGPNERRLELEEVAQTARKMCAAGKFPDLRADARCATNRGWKVEMSREKNLCPGSRR